MRTTYLSWILFSALLLDLVGCSSPVEEEAQEVKAPSPLAFDPNKAGLSLPENFGAVIVADDLGKVRHMAVRKNGDLYVMLRSKASEGGIIALRDTTQNGQADLIEYFGDFQGTGMQIYEDYLYFSTDTSVHRYPLSDNELVPSGNPETVVSDFAFETQHADKTFTIDNQGNLYVNIGAPSNACQEQDRTKGSPGQDPCPLLENYAGIWKFKANQTNQTAGQDGERFATGIRNAIAIHWNPISQNLYALQHGRDQLSQFYPDLYTQEESAQLPSEEFLLVKEGADFGWPYCYYDHLQEKKVLGPEYGGDGGEAIGRCADKDQPLMGFPGHYAPNDLIFYQGEAFPEKYRQGAFIAFHGSWNRAPQEQEGYNVVFVPFAGEKPSASWEVFADGFAGVDPIRSPRNAEHRPTGLVEAPDGSLYVSDDAGGRIYRIVYQG